MFSELRGCNMLTLSFEMDELLRENKLSLVELRLPYTFRGALRPGDVACHV